MMGLLLRLPWFMVIGLFSWFCSSQLIFFPTGSLCDVVLSVWRTLLVSLVPAGFSGNICFFNAVVGVLMLLFCCLLSGCTVHVNCFAIAADCLFQLISLGLLAGTHGIPAGFSYGVTAAFSDEFQLPLLSPFAAAFHAYGFLACWALSLCSVWLLLLMGHLRLWFTGCSAGLSAGLGGALVVFLLCCLLAPISWPTLCCLVLLFYASPAGFSAAFQAFAPFCCSFAPLAYVEVLLCLLKD
ncbi:unnamed protein product [Ilex paraguariensis]|uniref:Uncharacterized protein n=1 Tax=Ilex paraguariensis TaxID=185542 RepID=A0ABC8SN66_9AQUA